MLDIMLTSKGDLFVGEDGDIRITDSPAQAARIRLRWFLGEWKFNTALGVPYFEEVFTKSPNLERVKQIISEQLRAVDGITSVVSVNITPDYAHRVLSISFEAQAGAEKINEEVIVNA